ncbi:MAG: hypothetical protein U0X75_06860 [Acidobacteriota bacterium]
MAEKAYHVTASALLRLIRATKPLKNTSMKKDDDASRREFLQKIAATSMATAATPFASLAASEKAEERILRYESPLPPMTKSASA